MYTYRRFIEARTCTHTDALLRHAHVQVFVVHTDVFLKGIFKHARTNLFVYVCIYVSVHACMHKHTERIFFW
jgi:hypothetical protein